MTKKLEKIYARIADLALYALEVQADRLGIKSDTPESNALCEILTSHDFDEVNMNNYHTWDCFFEGIIEVDNKLQERIKEND